MCVPGAIRSELRPAHFARIKRLFGEAALEREAVANGYDFVFQAGEWEEVARFVALERKCCPFLSFAMEVTEGEDRLRLRIYGPPGSREVIGDLMRVVELDLGGAGECRHPVPLRAEGSLSASQPREDPCTDQRSRHSAY